MKDWVNSKISKSAELFTAPAAIAAKNWLHGVFGEPSDFLPVIYSVTRLLAGEPMDEFPEYPSVKIIMDAAEWAGLEKTAQWHRMLAVCLRNYNHLAEAKEHFETALAKDNRQLLTRWGLAKIYRMQGMYEKSLELHMINEGIMEKLFKEDKASKLEDLEDVNPEDLAECYDEIAQIYLEMSHKANALLYFRKAFDTCNYQYDYLFNFLQILHRGESQDSNEIVALLKSMEDKIDGPDKSRLSECLGQAYCRWSDSDFFLIVSSAAKEAGEVRWLQDEYRTAVNVAKRERQPLVALALDICLAELYTRYDDKHEEAVQI